MRNLFFNTKQSYDFMYRIRCKVRSLAILLYNPLFLAFLFFLGSLGIFTYGSNLIIPQTHIISQAHASSPSIFLHPSTGYALLGENFTVDIMLDTKGQETTTTKAVIKFDPDTIEVTEAQHGDLYCQYPEDEYTVDNQEGWIVLTGFCLDPYYSTASEAELFGRFTFQPIKEGETELKFITENSSQEDKTLAKDTGSPPQTISLTTEGAQYAIVSEGQPGDGDGDGDGDSDLPGVGIFDRTWVWLGGGLMGIAGAIIVSSPIIKKLKNLFGKKDGDDIIF